MGSNTSEHKMTFPEIYWVHEIEPIRLALMPRPRSGEWLEDEVTGWQRAGIQTIVCLLEAHEIQELGLQKESSLCLDRGIQFLPFPIPDRGTPNSAQEVSALVRNIEERLHRNEGVGIHCRVGIGRTGLLGACVLLKLGMSFPDVFPMLSRSRRLPVPDTVAQFEWVRSYSRDANVAI